MGSVAGGAWDRLEGVVGTRPPKAGAVVAATGVGPVVLTTDGPTVVLTENSSKPLYSINKLGKSHILVYYI